MQFVNSHVSSAGMAEYDEGLYVEVTTYDLQEYTDYYANVTGEFENDKINTFT